MYLEVEEEENTEEKEEKCTQARAYKQQSKGAEQTAQGHSCGDS